MSLGDGDCDQKGAPLEKMGVAKSLEYFFLVISYFGWVWFNKSNNFFFLYLFNFLSHLLIFRQTFVIY